MDHYSIIDSPASRQKDNGAVPEEAGAQAREGSQSAAEISIDPVPSPGAPPGSSPPSEPEAFSFTPATWRLDAEGSADLDSALQAIVQKAQYISSATGAAIALRQDSEVVCRAASGSSAPDRGARLQIKSGLTAECLRSGELIRCDNVMLDPRVDLESCKRLGIESIIIMPLHCKGTVAGVLELFSAHAYSFQDRDVEMVRGLGDEIGRRLAEAESPAMPPALVAPVSVPPEAGLVPCTDCGAMIGNDAVFCTECGVFQGSQAGSPREKQAVDWKTRIRGRRLVVPAVFVMMALVVAVVPIPHAQNQGVPGIKSAPQAAASSAVPAAKQPAGTSAPTNTANSSPAATNPSIANSVKQLLGGVSSDFSKLLPVNEKAEPTSNGDPNLKVWVDTRKGFYYCPGDEQYGHTDRGAFMTQRQAESNYYIPALIKPCM